MDDNTYRILYQSGYTYNLPVYLNDYAEQLGNMVGFDGSVGQVEEQSNFTYTGTGNTITIYNTVNTNKYSFFIEADFTINWGDGTVETMSMTGINDPNLSSKQHTYTTTGTKTIKVTIESPWTVTQLEKTIQIPFVDSFGFPTDLGTLTFNVPYSDPVVTAEQTYLTDYRTQTGQTPSAIIGFQGVGKSRVDEYKLYGRNAGYDMSKISIVSGYTGYTLDGLTYVDAPDGTTIITGSTADFYSEDVYNGMITRNEHFIGFVEDVSIFSDVFVERGQMGVMEKNFRLSEIDNNGELENYGNGYFNVIKQ